MGEAAAREKDEVSYAHLLADGTLSNKMLSLIKRFDQKKGQRINKTQEWNVKLDFFFGGCC